MLHTHKCFYRLTLQLLKKIRVKTEPLYYVSFCFIISNLVLWGCVIEPLGSPVLFDVIVDGDWTNWSPWGICSTTCNNGSWTRTRTCTNPAPAEGGKSCTGNSTEIGDCNIRPCPGMITNTQNETATD